MSCALFAQFDSGQISGFVRDESGAVVPGATVTATNEGTDKTNGSFGIVTGKTSDTRQLQLTLKYKF